MAESIEYNAKGVDEKLYGAEFERDNIDTGITSVKGVEDINVLSKAEEIEVKEDLQIFDYEIADLENKLGSMPLERAHNIARELYAIHKDDQNFPQDALDKLEEFTTSFEAIADDPLKHGRIIREVKIECLLSTETSPYLEVRANAEPFDDYTLPTLTFRVMFIGTLFAAAGSFIDTLFQYRNPPISVSTSVGQLVAYPLGKFLARVLPTKSFRLFGRSWSLNPGPFNKKEHMLITIMCNVSMTYPYTGSIVPVQYLPFFFSQKFAKSHGYQILNTMGTNMVGYGLAGLCRRFLVWPSFAVWPGTFNNMALVKAFHTETNEPVRGPFGKMYTWSREKFFLIAFLVMTFWYFFPGFIWQSLSYFSWITWIAPNNVNLDAVCGFQGGMGFNPWPTFDYNVATTWLIPLVIPMFSIGNIFASAIIANLTTLGIWYTNQWNTGYLPINSPDNFDNTGNAYNVSRIVNADGSLDPAAVQAYSEPWMSAGTITAYIFYFTMYSAAIVYVPLFHRTQVSHAFKGFWREVKKTFKRNVPEDETVLDEDIHARLMKKYKDVPEWVYLVVLLVFAAIGMVGVGVYPDHTSPVVLVFGIVVGALTVLPVGLVQSVTGLPIPTNVISEFVGGAFVNGDADALMYFKTYGYISTFQAVNFLNDLKLAHYTKIPPWHTFIGQMWATLVYVFVSSSVFNLALGFNDFCQQTADFHFTCPGQYQYFTAAIFWGTLGPKRLFGSGMRYNLMLLGFPIGAALVVAYWAARKKWPRWSLLRQIHPVLLTQGGVYFLAPWNMSYALPVFYLTFFSFKIIRPRYTEFWAKYNYVLAAAFPSGIAIAAVIIFFALEIPKGGLSINWWGNTVITEGCDYGGCPRLDIPADTGYFGPAPGSFRL